MNLKEIKLYLTIIFKNIVFYAGVLAVIGLSVFFLGIGSGRESKSIMNLAVISSYALLVYSICLLVLATYLSGNKVDILEFYNKNNFKKSINMFIALQIASFIPIIFNLGMCVINTKKEGLWVTDIIYLLIVWVIATGFLSGIGILAGSIFKNKYRYLLAMGIYLPFGLVTFSYDYSTYFKRAMNIYCDYMANSINYQYATRLDFNFILDNLFVINFTVIFFAIIYCLNKKKKVVSYFIIGAIFITIQIATYKGIGIDATMLDYREISNSRVITDNYVIKNCNMDLELDNKLKNVCSLEINIKNTTMKEISLNLSNLLKVEDLKVNNLTVDYKHKGDVLNIILPDNRENIINVNIEYSGRIYAEYENTNYVSYVSENYINLNKENLFWYPTIQQNDFIDFNIEINNNEDIYSNLDKTNTGFKGTDKGIVLTKGNYKEIEYKGVTIICPKVYENNEVEDYVEYIEDDIKKIMIVPIFINYEDNTLILDEIYKETYLIGTLY